MKKMKPHYSGDLSRKFWDRINKLPKYDRVSLYSCGCLLQRMEEDILQWLEEAEDKTQTTRTEKWPLK